jgi:hypothetical protein
VAKAGESSRDIEDNGPSTEEPLNSMISLQEQVDTLDGRETKDIDALKQDIEDIDAIIPISNFVRNEPDISK